jgi:hypothetical protein
MIVWQDIDPAEAEARMRGLVRRLAELDGALSAARFIAAQNPDSFAAKLSLNSLTQLQHRLESERVELVRHRVRERLELSLTGHSYDDHTAGVGELGVFLIRVQKLFSAIAQAITTGPRRRGPLSQYIVEATAMRFADVFPSSFGMEIYIRPQFDVFGESTAASTLQTLFSLLDAAKQEKEISRLSGELGQRAVGHFRHILDDLSRHNAGFGLKWVDTSGTQFVWSADRETIPNLQRNVARFRTKQSVEITIEAFLVGASLLRDRFELYDRNQGVIEGKLARDVKTKLRDFFGRPCMATLEKVEIDEAVSGDTRTFYTLVGITPIEAAKRQS